MHRFSAFWLRSKCSICSYQLNIWYEDHVSSSILNLFLQGDGVSGACSGSIKSWLCIAVSQRSAHFPTFNHAYSDVPMSSPINYPAQLDKVWVLNAAGLQWRGRWRKYVRVKTESLIGTLWWEWCCNVTRNPQVAYLSSTEHFIVKNGQNRFEKRCFLKL